MKIASAFVFLCLVGVSQAEAGSYQQGKIALVQYNADKTFGDIDTHTSELTLLAEEAVASGANIIMFPEGSTLGYASATELWCWPGVTTFRGKKCRDVSKVAQAVPRGKTTLHWVRFAIQHQVYVVYSIIEQDGDSFYSTQAVAGPGGFVGKYHKRYLYWVDQAYADAGELDGDFVLDTPYGRFGILICLDATYDSPLYTSYKKAGVNAVLVPMDWDDDPSGPYAAKTWFRGRAKSTQVDIYAADVPTWDGTGLYSSSGVPRARNELPDNAVGISGISYHTLNY